MTFSITILPALSDNYIYLLQDTQSNSVAVIDPGEAAPVIDYLKKNSLKLTHIFLTHHHYDHIDGIAALKEIYDPIIYAPAKNNQQIPLATNYVTEKDKLSFAESPIQIIETPGHTMGHLVYFFKKEKILFSGDTLFAMGCGRLFEGTAEMMYQSLQKIKALPSETKIYCGHEYSLTNARFALQIFPQNKEIQLRLKKTQEMRDKGLHTMGFTLNEEMTTNPFLMANSALEFAQYRDSRNAF